MVAAEVEPEPSKILTLSGKISNDKWHVIELLERNDFQTGSKFSVGYKVIGPNNSVAFAKILDFSRAFQEDNTAEALDIMLKSYIFERELLKLCEGHKLSRIIRGLDYGEIPVDGAPLGRFYFIIFEMSEKGDVRKYISQNGVGSFSWRMHVLHEIATGLRQLHSKNIHHQDLKPSNVLLFNDYGAKLGDLGRAHCNDLTAPHDAAFRPGAFYYAPPEQLYNCVMEDRLEYRLSGEMYLLGSMLDYFVTGIPTTVRLTNALLNVHKPFSIDVSGWRGYFADVLPHLEAAYAGLVREFGKQCGVLVAATGGPKEIANEITQYYRYATNPNPSQRGHPRARFVKHTSDYDLERFVSGFDILSKKLKRLERPV